MDKQHSIPLIAKQHMLPSTRWLLASIARSGQFSSIRLLTKDYSFVEAAARDLPESVRLRDFAEDCFVELAGEELALLDEGGSLHNALPEQFAGRAAGVEQTTFGLQSKWKCPVVLVCRSASKLVFESQIIARGILRKLEILGLLSGRTIGVIGLGALGSEVMHALLARGIPAFGSEVASVPLELVSNAVDVAELLRRCDVILGCSGVDALAGVSLNTVGGRKIFASCSSSDVEFRSVLSCLPDHQRFGVAEGSIGGTFCLVLNGGFPVNFDRETEWESFNEIILTRRLMLDGLIQAKALIGTAPRGIMLDPKAQLRIVNEWLDEVPDRDNIRIPSPMSEAFFRTHSEGEYIMNEKSTYSLHSTTPGALVRMRSHKEPYDTDVMGLPIIVLPNVWSPAYDWSSLFYVENMPKVDGREILEIGCGTGVISVFAGRAGARRIIATDVNVHAVENARLNFERFGVKQAEAIISDGFTNVRGKFDVVTWNAPYHGSKPADILERGCADEDYHDIRAFFRDVSAYLKPGGTVVFGFSESGNLPLIESLIAKNGFRIKRKLSDWRQDYNCMLFDLVRAKAPAS